MTIFNSYVSLPEGTIKLYRGQTPGALGTQKSMDVDQDMVRSWAPKLHIATFKKDRNSPFFQNCESPCYLFGACFRIFRVSSVSSSNSAHPQVDPGARTSQQEDC